jgi:hypothetical protein
MKSSVVRLALAVAAALSFGTAVAAADFEPEFRTLGLGVAAADLTTEGYEAFACGSDGGTPLAPIEGWIDYAKCAPDELGLHEVYVEYGRRAGELAERFRDEYDDELWIQRFVGTRMANFPVVLSLLFDDQGISRGFRAITDERAPTEDRGRAYLFRYRVMELYNPALWTCVSIPPSDGETPVGDTYVHDICKQTTADGKFVRVSAEFYRKRGQTGHDINGMYVEGEYKSMTRWEVFDPALPNVEAVLDEQGS